MNRDVLLSCFVERLADKGTDPPIAYSYRSYFRHRRALLLTFTTSLSLKGYVIFRLLVIHKHALSIPLFLSRGFP